MSGLDWAGLMRAGLHDLRLQPEAFWRLTPVELLVMLGMESGTAPLTRARLEELARQFPDRIPALPDRTSALPDRTPALPDTTSPMPDTTSALPDRTPALPETTGAADEQR